MLRAMLGVSCFATRLLAKLLRLPLLILFRRQKANAEQLCLVNYM
jgi:hypothetical protein